MKINAPSQKRLRFPFHIEKAVLMSIGVFILSVSQAMAFGFAILSPSRASAITADQMSFNVKTDFGAVGDGTTDDSQAFQNAFNEMASKFPGVNNKNVGVSLYIPAGTYKITKKLSFRPPVASFPDSQGVVIRGAGTSDTTGTIIKSSNAGGALFFDFTLQWGNQKTVQIEDIQLQATAPAAGPAIEIIENLNNQTHNVTPVLRSVKITGSSPSGYYTYGFKGHTMTGTRMSEVTVNGYAGTATNSFTDGTKACVYLQHSYGGLTEDCTFSGADYGFQAEDTSEGNNAVRASISNVNIGFSVHVLAAGGLGPSCSGGGLLNCTVKARQVGALLDHKSTITIGGNTFIKEVGGSADYINIYLIDCYNVITTDNLFAPGGDSNQTGVVVENLVDANHPVVPKHTTIAYNDFGACSTGVEISAGCLSTRVLDNVADAGNPVVINLSGGETVIRNGTIRSRVLCPASVPNYPVFNWTTIANFIGAANTINVKDPLYGAKGDGITDDTTAITNAVAALKAKLNGSSRQGALYFPAGTYKLKDSINLTEDGSAKWWKRVLIYGDGVGATLIRAAAPFAGVAKGTGLIKVKSNDQTAVTIHNLSLTARAPGIKSAIEVNQPSQTNSAYARSLVMFDVATWIGSDVQNCYFQTNVVCTGLINPLMRHVTIDSRASINYDQKGVKLSGGYGFECDYTLSMGSKTAFDITTLGPVVGGTAGDVLIRGMPMNNSEQGMIINAGGAKVAAEGAHLNALSPIMEVNNASEVQFVKCFTIGNDDIAGMNPPPTMRATLRLTNCKDAYINDSFFLQSLNLGDTNIVANTNRTSVHLADYTGGASTKTVIGNMYNESGEGIVLSPNNLNVKINDNRFMTPIDRSIVDFGTGTTFLPPYAQQIIQEP